MALVVEIILLIGLLSTIKLLYQIYNSIFANRTSNVKAARSRTSP